MADNDAWDADDFEPSLPQTKSVTDRWDGEDEEDDVKDSWADSDDEEKKEQDGKTESQAYQRPKKKPLADRIAEKEAQKKKEEEEEKARLEEEKRELTAEDKLAEKIRLKKIQEQGDLSLAKGLFGKSNKLLEDLLGVSESSIDKMIPTTEEEFKQFGEALKSKITFFEESKYYSAFVEKLISDLALGLSVDDVKKLSTSINTLYHEKERQRKEQDKKKKKKSKATIRVDKPDDFDLIGDASGNYGYDDDDFI